MVVDIRGKIGWARGLLRSVHHVAMATVHKDGSPSYGSKLENSQ